MLAARYWTSQNYHIQLNTSYFTFIQSYHNSIANALNQTTKNKKPIYNTKPTQNITKRDRIRHHLLSSIKEGESSKQNQNQTQEN